MKIRTAVISVVVSASLVAGAGYGAYYAVNGQKTPVEVVPVSNVNQYYWGDDEETIYGTITSQVSQLVYLNDDYTIDEIYVEEGDDVKEGDALFAYDMTLQELELEMSELTLQTYELTLTRLEKDLQKYKNGEVDDDDGTLDDWEDEYSASADTETPADETLPIEEPMTADEASRDGLSSDDANQAEEQQEELLEEPSDGGTSSGGSQSAPSQDGIQIEGIEVVDASSEEGIPALKRVSGFEQLVGAIDALFTEYGDGLAPEEIGESIDYAVSYFRNNLASEQVTVVTDEDGSSEERREYVIREDVRSAIGETAAAALEQYVSKLDRYQIRYVEMLIEAADAQKETLSEEGLQDALSRIEEEYALLATSAQEQVENLAVLEALKTYEAPDTGTAALFSEEEQSGSDTETVTETESEPETETVTETESEPETQTGSEPETESESVAEPETSGAYYTLTLKLPDSEKTEKCQEGKTVSLTATTADLMMIFSGWELEADEELNTDGIDLTKKTIEFQMPSCDVTAIANYEPNGDRIGKYVTNFMNMAEDITGETASRDSEYFKMFANAIEFYQSWLAVPGDASADPEEVLNEFWKMESYQFKAVVKEYLDRSAAVDESETEGGDQAPALPDAEELENTYEELCKSYMIALIRSLCGNSSDIDGELLERAAGVYEDLGDTWQKEVEKRWAEDPANTSHDTIKDILAAYTVLQLYQSYLEQRDDLSQTERQALLAAIWSAYDGLTDAQKAIARRDHDFEEDVINTHQESAETETQSEAETAAESEPETWDNGDWEDGYDDWYDGYDGSDGYTAEELQELIESKEREIKECELNIRESELTVAQQQRIVDGKTVTSTMDGTVIAIGNPDGESDTDYFAKIANESGLYAKGSMSELALEQLHIGDTVSGMLIDTGISFTAVIKEISEYPDASGSSSYYGSGNTNASFYPFYAKLEDTEDIEEGDAEIYLSGESYDSSGAIYLDKSFVRTANDGKSYVYIQGEDGALTKRYVTTGKIIYSYAIEISSGLTLEDKIAFPYGANVTEGASTKEVDYLSDY